METLFGLLVPIVFVIVVIVNVIARLKQEQKRGQRLSGEDEDAVYKASPEEIKQFLRTIGGEPPEPPRETRAAPGLSGSIVPTAPRQRRLKAQAGRRMGPTVPPAPPGDAGEEVVRRLVTEDEHLKTDIEKHLRERSLSEEQLSLRPTVERHLKQAHLAEDQESLQPTIDAHLKEARLEDMPGAGAPGSRARRAAAAWQAVAAPTAGAPQRKRGVALGMFDNDSLKRALVLSEVLSPPLALRGRERPLSGSWAARV